MAIWAKHFQIVGTAVLRIPVHMINLSQNRAVHRVPAVPSALLASGAAQIV
jgi:hypothetical protein